jgi:hypothetical protein
VITIKVEELTHHTLEHILKMNSSSQLKQLQQPAS